MRRKIAVIGGGQLGSRHLQACSGLENVDLFLVDPAPRSLNIALERYRALATSQSAEVKALSSITGLPETIDLAIVATTASVRFEVLKSIVAQHDVRNWLLEKVLFQDLSHYDAADALLGDAVDHTWVNCAQRLWPYYQNLRARYGGDPHLEINVTGSNWGLGCNGVHHSDIAAFLWKGALHHHAILDVDMPDSKRPTYKEFTGLLETSAEGGGRVRQISYAAGQAPFVVDVAHPSFNQRWDVTNGKMWERGDQSGWEWVCHDLKAPLQSVLTKQVAEDVLAGRDCGLPRYREAVPSHLGTLSALIEGARRNGHDLGNICPVT